MRENLPSPGNPEPRPTDPLSQLCELLRDALTGRRETYVRFVLLVVIFGALVIVAHLVGVPMPWGS
jgi:hypothetical protein